MIDNKDESRFELEENGYRAWAEYRIRDGKYFIPHVEAEPPLRGTGAAGRLMQQIVDHAREQRLVLVPRCSYARAWFERHPEAEDVLD
ncbi:MAG TPA: GNAT family N-acetyltransferase [Rhizomicrobium sp.]|nr:GNAT family N-acetyltransferase [Rhizomicrobium sp.]